MAGKKFLFAPNVSDNDLAKKIIRAFMRKAFLTDSALFLLIELNEDSEKLFRYVKRMAMGTPCTVQFLYKNQIDINAVMKQMDAYIIGESPDEDFYLTSALLSDVKIMSTANTRDFESLFDDISVSPEVQKFKENINTTIKRELFDKFPLHEYEYFLFSEGLGDSLAFLFWLKEYRKHTDKKILLMIFQDSRLELMKLCPYVDKIVKITEKFYDYVSVYFYGHYGLKILSLSWADNWGNNLFNENDPFPVIKNMQYFLNIPEGTKFERYPVNIPKENLDRAAETFQSMGLVRGKTIFVNHEGVAYGNLLDRNNISFFLKLLQTLRNAGFEIVFNSKDKIIHGCKNVFLPLLETVAFAGMCENVISVPTGLCEVIGALNPNYPLAFHFIFPNRRAFYYRGLVNTPYARMEILKELKNYGESFVEKRMELYSNVLEKIYSSSSKFYCYRWGYNTEENELLVDDIARRIINH